MINSDISPRSRIHQGLDVLSLTCRDSCSVAGSRGLPVWRSLDILSEQGLVGYVRIVRIVAQDDELASTLVHCGFRFAKFSGASEITNFRFIVGSAVTDFRLRKLLLVEDRIWSRRKRLHSHIVALPKESGLRLPYLSCLLRPSLCETS